MTTRKIFKGATPAQFAVRDMLALLFAQELLAPGEEIFVVAPWISNVIIFDNRTGQFDTLNPQWGRREIHLIEVLTTLAAHGTRIRIYTRPEVHNRRFRLRFNEAVADLALQPQCSCTELAYLHTKGLLTETAFVDGSMNLTENGVAINDESVTVSFASADIAKARIHFSTYESDR